MTIRKIGIATLAVTLIASVPSFTYAQVQPQGQAKPEQMPEAKPAKATPAGLAGKWNVTLQTGSDVQSVLVIKADPKDEKKITGTITSPQGEAPLEGTVIDGKLTFAISINSNGQAMSITFIATQQKDGSLAGTLTFGQGEMAWSAIKEKK